MKEVINNPYLLHETFLTGLNDYKLNEASVMIPLIRKDDKLHVLFEVRSSKLSTQPGEVCFPGGHIEADETARDALLREINEELLVSKDDIEITDTMPRMIGPRNIIINIFIGLIHNYNNTYSNCEVDNVFTIPLEYFIGNKPVIYTAGAELELPSNLPWNLIPDGRNYHWRKQEHIIPFYTETSPVIWGITARILNDYIRIIEKGIKKGD